MKILQVCPRYYPSVGGVEYVVKSVAERLVKRGHDVTVLCGEPSLNTPREEWINGVHVFRWPVWAPMDAYHFPGMRGKLKSWLLNAVKGCDVVHFHSVHSVFTVYSLNSMRGYNVRRVLTMHYHGTGHTLLRRILWFSWRSICRQLSKYVDVVHSVSLYEAGLIRRDFRVEPVIIEHGVEEWIADVKWKPENYVMYSGRIEKYKNIHRLGNIVKNLNKAYGCALKLRIFGEGTYRKRLEKHLKKLGIDFALEPSLPYEEYIYALSRAKFFALLSQKEAFGQTVNEANAIGVPVIVAEPWGRNFEGRSRTLIVNLEDGDEAIAAKLAKFLCKAGEEPKSSVPTWSDVVNLYFNKLYSLSRT